MQSSISSKPMGVRPREFPPLCACAVLPANTVRRGNRESPGTRFVWTLLSDCDLVLAILTALTTYGLYLDGFGVHNFSSLNALETDGS